MPGKVTISTKSFTLSLSVLLKKSHPMWTILPLFAVYPDKCCMWLAGFTDMHLQEKMVGFWDDVYGFKMSCMKTEVVSQTAVDVMTADKVITLPCLLKVRLLFGGLL